MIKKQNSISLFNKLIKDYKRSYLNIKKYKDIPPFIQHYIQLNKNIKIYETALKFDFRIFQNEDLYDLKAFAVIKNFYIKIKKKYNNINNDILTSENLKKIDKNVYKEYNDDIEFLSTYLISTMNIVGHNNENSNTIFSLYFAVKEEDIEKFQEKGFTTDYFIIIPKEKPKYLTTYSYINESEIIGVFKDFKKSIGLKKNNPKLLKKAKEIKGLYISMLDGALINLLEKNIKIIEKNGEQFYSHLEDQEADIESYLIQTNLVIQVFIKAIYDKDKRKFEDQNQIIENVTINGLENIYYYTEDIKEKEEHE